MGSDIKFKGLVSSLTSAIESGNSRDFTRAAGDLMVQAHAPGNPQARKLYAAVQEAGAWHRNEQDAMVSALTTTGFGKLTR